MQKEKNLFGACGLAVRTALLCFVMLVGFVLGISAQQKAGVFTGTVIDDGGEPLVGVSVTVKNVKSIGVVTDAEGRFTMPAQDQSAVLVFSYVGMKTQEVRAQVGKRLTVRLQDDGHMIDETVVTGIYSRNKESFTGNAATFRQEQLKEINALNLLQSVAALDPSFQIADNIDMGSNPNADMNISINGTTTIQGLENTYSTHPDQPLFILDGFETTLQRISDLSMDRVESITLLKDAASAAIYGSKAANGVVVVETKKPEAGRLRFSYNTNLQLAWADLRDYNLMNSAEKLEFEKLSGYYGALDETGEILMEGPRRTYYERYAAVASGLNSYWMSEPLRNAFTNDHSFNAEGGDSAFRYGMTFRYRNTQGVMKGSDRQNVDGTINLSYRVKNFNLSNQTNIDYVDANDNVVSFREFSGANPYYAKYTEDGEINKIIGTYYDNNLNETYVYNPLWDSHQTSYNNNNQLQFNNNLNLEYMLINNLRLQARFGFTTLRSKNEAFKSPYASQFANVDDQHKGSFSQTNGTRDSYDGSFIVSYGNSVGAHTYNLLAGAQFMEQSSKDATYSATGYISDKFSNPNFSNGYPEGSHPYSVVDKSRSVNYYFNGNYSYDMRYLFDVNLRNDGTSVFGVNNHFSTTYSFGVAWNAHNEKFFKNLFNDGTISYLKLRYTFGNPGNQNIDAKMSNSVYTYYTSYPNIFGLASIVSRWGNKDLQWKRTLTHNIGLNLGMLNNRLMFTVNYTMSDSDPELINVEQPTSTGTSSIPMNIGATRNRTWAFTASYDVIRKRDLSVKLYGNLMHTKTKYDKIGDSLEKLNEEGRANQSLIRYYDGASVSAIYAVRSAGIDPARGDELFIKKDGSYTYKWDSNDEVKVGDSTPDASGNFGATVVWKNWTASANFQYRLGGEVKLTTLLNKVENINQQALAYNQDRRALTERWQKPGDVVNFKRISDTSTTNMSSRFIMTENTLQCRSISLAYRDTSSKWLSPLGLTSVTFSIYANDIFRLSTIKAERGLDYPFQRSVAASIGLRF